jgi:hypothetical protein
MAKSVIPNPLDRRHLIEKDLSEAQARKLAEAYRADGRLVEAIEFLVKAGATEQLGELRSQAVREGDAFLLRSVARAMDETPSREEWSDVAEAAEASGKNLYAAEARRQVSADAAD